MNDAVSSRQRLLSIDALRGLVILFMLLDHVRETFLLHRQVSDPMSIDSTEPALFISRTLAHVCAPVFVLLTGLSAWLYGQKYQGRRDVSAFLFKRGLFLIVLEFSLVNFAWTFQLPPSVIYLQVIWAIGLSMIALAALVWLPRPLLITLALVIVAGHNLLDAVHFAAGSAQQSAWAILHERSWIEASDNLRLRTTYPVLPWFGVIALGYGLGPWFANTMSPALRQRYLLRAGLGALVGFVLLLALERAGQRRWIGLLAVFGAAPMFFYLLHLYVLKILYVACVALFGLNHGDYFGFDSVGAVWWVALLLPIALYRPVRWFAGLKARRRDMAWLKYL